MVTVVVTVDVAVVVGVVILHRQSHEPSGLLKTYAKTPGRQRHSKLEQSMFGENVGAVVGASVGA